MKQKTKDIIGALLLGLLCTLALSAVITVADTETARTDLMIGMQYETTGLDLDAAPGLLVGLVKLHQNFPLDAWAWGPAAAGLAGAAGGERGALRHPHHGGAAADGPAGHLPRVRRRHPGVRAVPLGHQRRRAGPGVQGT